MKIVIYYHSAGLGGQQTQICNLIRDFSRLKHQVTWCYETGSDNISTVSENAHLEKIALPKLIDKSAKYFLPKLFFFVLKSLYRLFWIFSQLKKYDCSLVISNDLYGSLLCGLIARFKGIKHFRMIGGDDRNLNPGWYKYYRITNHDKLVDGYFGFPKVNEDYADIGVQSKKLPSYTYNAVDTNKFFPLDASYVEKIRDDLKISKNDLVIGWVGRLQPRMQVGNTVRLGKKLLDLGMQNFFLLIVGGGLFENGIEDRSYPEELRSLCADLGLMDKVLFTDWVPPHEMNEYINAMDIVPLLEDDPHGGSLIREAMACGKLTISVDGKSHTQKHFMHSDFSILLSDQNYINDCAEKISSLAKDRRQIETMGRKAREYCTKHMSSEQQARDIIEYYEAS